MRIELLLHCHYNPTPVPELGGKDESKEIRGIVNWLLSLGAIEDSGDDEDNRYITTDRGRAWVEALCRVEVPRATFVDRDGTVLL